MIIRYVHPSGGNQGPGWSSRRLSSQSFEDLLSKLGGKKTSLMPDRGTHSLSQRRLPKRGHAAPAKEEVIRPDSPAVEDLMRHVAPAMAQRAARDAGGLRYWEKGLAKASPTPLPPTDR